MKHVILKKNEERRLLLGHQWIFSNEIHRVEGNPAAGDVVEIRRSDGKSLGCGFYNPHSLIAVRFLSPEVIEINQQFFETRIQAADSVRRQLFPESTVYRAAYSESDFLPGLILDRFNDFFSIQTFSAGMDIRLPVICEAVKNIFSPAGIVERNESQLRSLEHLPERNSLIYGTVKKTIIELNGIQFDVDILNGQKSGFFLDQRINRTVVQQFVKGKTVLDCFCNEGGFGLYAAKGEAAGVTNIDSSSEALERATTNAQLNNLKNIQFVKADVFEFLQEQVKTNQVYDMVILDPPSFTKSKKTVATAVKGYKEINTNGLRLVKPGGIFVSASCSHHISEEQFLNILNESSVKAKRKIRLLSLSGASPDHPVLPSMIETRYLKFAMMSVE
ncbi:MAG: class I SAM-dependent rRNA methyltransferase [Bacteroidetes bacterium]|nr:class I SAM-dependent rRNA methyltransferase [Bacteroidota bacterium]